MRITEKGHHKRSEVRIYQSVFRNALSDLESGEYPSTGELCMDIASLGYAQSLAVDEIFDPKEWNMGVKDRLAARVCESCVVWLDCDKRVQGKVPMDEANPFMVFELDRTLQDYGLVPIVTPTMRYKR